MLCKGEVSSTRIALLAIALQLCWCADSANAVIKVVAVSGTPAPDGNGSLDKFLDAVLNNAGQVAFRSYLAGTSGGISDFHGIFLGDGNTLTQIARRGQLNPRGTSVFSDVFPYSLNDDGEVAFQGLDFDTSNIGVFRSNGQTLTQIDRQQAPEGNGIIRSASAQLNNQGQLALNASLIETTGGPVDDRGIYVFDEGSGLTKIARTNDLVPNSTDPFTRLESMLLNVAGQVAFRGAFESTQFPNNPFGLFRGDGQELVTIARHGDPAPDGSAKFTMESGNIVIPSFNDAGQVVFSTFLDRKVGPNRDEGVFRGDGIILEQIARAGQRPPDGPGEFWRFYPPDINNSGDVAFAAGLNNHHGSEGIFIGDGGPLTQVIRTGEPAPDGNGTFNRFDDPDLNDSGQLTFHASFKDVSERAHFGILFYDNHLGLRQVVRWGDPFLGSTITNLQNFMTHRRGKFNNLGQVAFTFELADGREGVAIWSPVPEPATFVSLIMTLICYATMNHRHRGLWPTAAYQRTHLVMPSLMLPLPFLAGSNSTACLCRAGADSR